MRPTFLGLKAGLFYAVLMGAFFATPYSNLFFLLLAFLTILGVANFFWTRGNLSGVSGRVYPPEPAPVGRDIELHADIEGEAVAAAIELRLEGRGRVRDRVEGLPRGVYRVISASLVSSWPLGLLTARVPLDQPDELIIYPSPAELPSGLGGKAAVAELCGAAHGADGMSQPSLLREYRPGDGMRRVNWRATARRGYPVVTEWEGGGEGVAVVLDRRTSHLDDALAALAAIATVVRDAKETLTLHTQGLSATFGEGQRPWRDFLRFLALADLLPAGGPPPPPAPPSTPRLGGMS